MKVRKKSDSSKDSASLKPWLWAAIERLQNANADAVLFEDCEKSQVFQRTGRIVYQCAQKFADFLSQNGVGEGHIVIFDEAVRREAIVVWCACQMVGASLLFLPADLKWRDFLPDLDKIKEYNQNHTCVVTANPQTALTWKTLAEHILFLDNQAPDGQTADKVLGWPLPEHMDSFEHAIETHSPKSFSTRLNDECAAAIVYSQGSHQNARQISLSYEAIASQAEEIALQLDLNGNSRVFIDMASIQTITLVVMAACVFAGATFICKRESCSIGQAVSASHATHVFIRPHELACQIESIKSPQMTSKLKRNWRVLCLNVSKFRERNTKNWLNWTKPVIEKACIGPLRKQYFPDVKTVISYGNHFKSKCAELLTFLDIAVKNAFVISEIGIVHLHHFKGTGGFLKCVDARIKNGLLSVRCKKSKTFIQTGDRVFEDERCGLCSHRNIEVTLSAGTVVDTSPMREILKRSEIIDEVFIFGQDRPFLSALIYLDPEALRAYALSQKIPNESFEFLAQNPTIYAHIRGIVDGCNLTRRVAESIQKLAILPVALDDDPRILTPCRLARLGEIEKRYAALINGFYSDNF